MMMRSPSSVHYIDDTPHGFVHQDTPESIRASRNTGQFSYISSDASSNDDEIESELFNDENMFPTEGRLQQKRASQPLQPSPAPFHLKSPQKIHTRPSMRIAGDDGARISMFKSRYSQNNPNIASKLSLASSLADITNISNLSNVSLASRRTSHLSNQSYQTRRNRSLTDNASTISIEQKRNQIIQRLNKRNSKNLSNPYFYQYKENKQPSQAPPEAPEAPEDPDGSFDYGHSRMMSSTFGSFSDVISNSPVKSTEESLNFNDIPPVKTRTIFTISEDRDTTHAERNRVSSSGQQDHDVGHDSNGNGAPSEHEQSRGAGEDNDGYANRSNGNNTSSNTSHNNSKNSGTKTDSTKNTTSGDDTTSSDEREISRRIRLSQEIRGGLFSELQFTPVTAGVHGVVLSGIEDESLNDESDSVGTVSTDRIQLRPVGANPDLTGGHHFAVLAQPAYQPKLLADDDDNGNGNSGGGSNDATNSRPGPVMTVNVMNHSDGSRESRSKNFTLSNNSSVSVVAQVQPSRSETVLDLTAEPEERKKRMFRKPPPPSASPSPTAPLTLPTANFTGAGVGNDTEATSNLIRSVKQSNKQLNLERVPIVPHFPAALYSNHSIELNSDDTDTTQGSGDSREQLLAWANPRKNTPAPPPAGKHDPEKAAGLVSNDYRREYHDYELHGSCSGRVAVLLLLCSVLAPPFFLVIALGHLDSIFGAIARRYKLTAAVLFGLFCLGSAIGIAVGFGYGLRHKM